MPSLTKPRCAIYVRVSTAGQEEDGTSLETQETLCRRYADEHNYEVVGVWRDVYSGGVYRERPGLSQLRALVRDHSINVVVVYAVDRLSRNQAHLYILAEEISDAGARLGFVTEDFEQSAVGKFILSARAFAAEVEREKIAERTQRGKRARAASGRPIGGGLLPFGYRWADDEHSALAPDPVTAPLLQQIFAWSLEGWTLRRIAQRLNELEIPTARGRRLWSHTTIRGILTNPTYIGQREAFRYVQVIGKNGGKRMIERPKADRILLPPEASPALVSAETFAGVQLRLRRNQELARRNARYPEDVAILRGFVVCGHCGGSMAVKRVGPGGDYYHYRCIRGMTVSHPCRGSSIAAHVLDTEVWNDVAATLNDRELIQAQIDRLQENDPTAEELARVERQLAEVERQQANQVRNLALFSDPQSAAPVVAHIETLRARAEALATEHDDLLRRRVGWESARQQLEDLEAWCHAVAGSLESADVSLKRLAFEAIGLKVRVWRAGSTPRYDVWLDLPSGAIVDVSSAASVHKLTLQWTDRGRPSK